MSFELLRKYFDKKFNEQNKRMESKLHSDARQIEKKLKFSKPVGEIDFNNINFKLVEKLENIICLVSEGSKV